MEKVLTRIWEVLGIPQVWGAILTVLILVVAYLLKKLLDVKIAKQKADREAITNQFADIAKYSNEQSVGLIKAYMKLYEKKEGVEAVGKEYISIIEEADNDLMKPLREYQPKLDNETKAKIFHIHNILAQYYPATSDESIQKFKSRKSEFYVQINKAQEFIRPDQVLYRLGIISSKLQD